MSARPNGAPSTSTTCSTGRANRRPSGLPRIWRSRTITTRPCRRHGAIPTSLQQVFLNLLKNAAEAGREGGTIRIRTFYELSLKVRRRDGTGGAVPLQVEITDDGPGIPPDIAADIFEPFVSGRENGTGLGLALISKIISDHDGWIAVDSVPGRTVFRISLPVAPREVSP
jgi:two-component system nitrogen regulation sensor histidine kinase GlnL